MSCGRDNLFHESVAQFVAGGDGRISDEVSQRMLDHVLTAAKELQPEGIRQAVLPLVCQTFTNFGGRSARDEGARSLLLRALDAVSGTGPANAEAVSEGLKHVQDAGDFQLMVEDVPLAPQLPKTLKRQ
jgi:hypothetical protein